MPVNRKPAKARPSTSPKGKPQNGTSKKMGSLSSIQATLKFTSRPPNTQNDSSSTKDEEDRKKMPPPPPGVRGRVASSSDSHTSGPGPRVAAPRPYGASSNEKGKGRAEDPVDMTVDDEGHLSRPSGLNGGLSQMWADQFAPTTMAELAPGKARISRVKDWLFEAIHGHPPDAIAISRAGSQTTDRARKYRRILILTGPAGAGKTTTLKIIAEELGLDVVEWNETIEERSLGGGFDRESPMAKLSSFLSRNSFTPLSLTQSTGQASSSSAKPKLRVLLLSSIPNLSHRPTKEAFHAALLSFCQTYTPTSCPLVIIHSSAGSGGRAEESWMDRDRGAIDGIAEILGKDIRDGPYYQEVDFLPLATTFTIKALNRVLPLAVPRSADRPPASAVQLIALTCGGDLRSAINSLQLLCSRPLDGNGKKRKRANGDAGAPRQNGRLKGKGAKVDLSDDLRAVLDVVSRKEQSLNLFHALGKIFYNKRIDDFDVEKDDAELYAAVRALPKQDQLPAHLVEFKRSKSMVQMEAYLPTIPVDASSFALWIHQSLPLFCTEIEQVGAAYDDLCGADIMRTDDDIWQSSPQAIAYALHIAVRGSHMALPSPVPRNRQKINKPQFFESYRVEQKNLDNLNYGAGYLSKKAVASSNKLSELDFDEDHTEASWGGSVQKNVFAAELLPMMIKIQALSRRPLLPSTLQSLAFPPYATVSSGDVELRSNESLSQEQVEMTAGEEASTIPDNSAWVDEGEDAAAQEVDGMVDDEIEDWD